MVEKQQRRFGSGWGKRRGEEGIRQQRWVRVACVVFLHLFWQRRWAVGLGFVESLGDGIMK